MNYVSFLDNKTALSTLAQMIGNAIKECSSPDDARELCGLVDDYTADEKVELESTMERLGLA